MKKILMSFTILSVAIILVSCLNNRPRRDCPITELVFNETDYPTEFIINRLASPIAEAPKESAGRTASYRQNLTYQQVSRYRSRESAEEIFQEELEYIFSEDDLGKPWVTPESFSYISPVAQKYHMACGNVLSAYQCVMISQYEEYYVFFFAYISEDGITLDIVEELLQKIDQKMEQCLQTEE